jgi:hypothetical protein
MKKRTLFLTFVALATLAALAVVGCSMDPGAKTGAMTFAFSPAARTLGAGESYRVEIYYGSDLYDSAVALVSETIATVFVAQGSGSGESFVASRYGSFEVTIAAGDNNPEPLTLAAVPFRSTLAGVGVKSVVSMGSDVYVATTGNLLKRATYAAGAWSSPLDGPVVPTGMGDLSLSLASYFTEGGFAPQVWVNGTWNPGTPRGTGGIMPWIGSSLDQGLASGFSLGTNWSGTPAAFTVLRSGSFSVPATGAIPDGLAIFYQRNGGMGGVYVTRSEAATQSTWHWIMNQIDISATLGDLVAQGQEPILDFAVSSDALYVVMGFTTLRVSKGLLQEGVTSAQAVLESDFVKFATGVTSPIVSIAVAGNRIHLGTNDGLWEGQTGTTGFFATGTGPVQVAATVGYRVRTISVSPDGEHVAFISSRGEGADFLAVMPVAAPEELRTYRTLEGLPGTALTSLVWLDNGKLIVAGNGGLAELDVVN